MPTPILMVVVSSTPTRNGSTLIGNESIIGLYPKRRSAEYKNASGISGSVDATLAVGVVVRGLNQENVGLFLKMCKCG
ncbi:hypothetical protein GC096_11365 [Paenibacillus sp. LMG 31461]|uniref:Uncharacterized protein n=1 Tax=Paenibacillus plantarum TaxID=2654975 RepID=A0ABX1X9C4_9BACL|nr:hypothetical protein [Paenibacillus plantarum]NOU64628.1 hypothetical protein [Paenibacillus plantarum]